MKIDHFALYTEDLPRMRAFYERFFAGRAGAKYHNSATGLETIFLQFPDGGRLELMRRPGVAGGDARSSRLGYAHLAFTVGTPQGVDRLSAHIREAGYPVLSGPRMTGDGYYESCVLDPDGNPVELVAE